jgi:hypothetical protein
MIVPFNVLITDPATTNTPQRLLNTTDNLILASMISGSSNTLNMFGLLLPTGNFYLSRIRYAHNSATAGPVSFGVYSATTTNFYEIFRQASVIGALVDVDFCPRSRSTYPTDYLLIPQSLGYVFAAKWGNSGPSANINIEGELEILPLTPPYVTALLT